MISARSRTHTLSLFLFLFLSLSLFLTLINIKKCPPPHPYIDTRSSGICGLSESLWTFKGCCPQCRDSTPRTILQELNSVPGSSGRNICLVPQKVLCSLGKLLRCKRPISQHRTLVSTVLLYLIKTYILTQEPQKHAFRNLDKHYDMTACF